MDNEQKLEDLKKRINDYEKQDPRTIQTEKEKQSSSSFTQAGAGLFSAVLMGLLLGMGIDTVFNTKPWGTLILLFFGIIAGFKHLFESINKK